MREKLIQSITFAVVAAITVGVAPSFAADDILSNGNNIIADGMVQQHTMRRVFKRSCAQKVVTKKEVVVKTPAPIVKETIIEKPVVIEKIETPAPVEQTLVQPAVIEPAQPVIVERYVKHHRSLLHIGLFPRKHGE